MRNNNIKQMTYAALLTAFAIIIPIQFGFLKVIVGPFTATLASHVPMFIAMLISPFVAVVVGIGSTLGFFFSGTPLFVVARASIHILVGLAGAVMIKNKVSYWKVMFATAFVHSIGEAIAVIPFGWNFNTILITVAVGTFIHHFVDAAIAYSLVKAISKSTGKNFTESLAK